MFLSFSGIDGAGKSTQINALHKRLTEAGIQVLLLTFWDDVAVLRRFREAASHGLFKGDKGIGSPDRPLRRKDKNVRSWYLTGARLLFYLLDILRLNLVVTRASRSDTDIVIFDRYIYDELANLSLHQWLGRAYVQLVLKLVPRPDLAYLLDADPQLARDRKPEYPVDFLRTNRASYFDLRELTGMTVISGTLPVVEVEKKIMEKFLTRWHELNRVSSESPQVDSSP